MRSVPSPILPSGSARVGLGLVSLFVAAALWGPDRSPAQSSSALGGPMKTSNALAEHAGLADAQLATRARARRATRLHATTGCNSKREPFVRFQWVPARRRGLAQRVDYTEFFRGLSNGSFHKSRKLGPRKRRWSTTKIETGLDYSWRVMTRRAHRWVSSKVRPFDAPVCVD